MTPRITLVLAAFALVGVSNPAAEPARSCCAQDANGVATAAQPSNRSIYQIEATWTDDAGGPARLNSLQGRPVVLAMFFTNCVSACPVIVSNMLRVQEALPGKLRAKARFVLVSFDSERDTPAELRLYRERMGLGADWELLHGRPDDVRELAMVLGVKYAKDNRGQFAHSNLITVLNPEGEIAFQLAGLKSDISAVARAVVAADK